MRGQLAEAEGALKEALSQDPNNPDAAEAYAEVLLQKGDAAAARDVLKRALEAHPESASLEESYARAVLAVSEAEHTRTLAYAETVRKGTRQPRSAALPPVASLLICGLGQFLNEEAAKGLVMAALAYISLLLAFLIGGQSLIRSFSSWLVGGNLAAATGRPPEDVGHVSGFAVFLIIAFALTVIVSIADAAVVAKRGHGPRTTPTGWEV